jgi:CheY-like chemotaxis protein
MSEKTKKANFIIIDDSELDCFIAAKLIRHSGMSKNILSFLAATEALAHIKGIKHSQIDEPTIIILDLLMPLMSGVEFVEEFEKLPMSIRNKYLIVAFTSSMNKKDMSRIKSFKSVKYTFDKPINAQVLLPLIDECNSLF